MNIILVLIGLVAVVLLWVMGNYNSLVALRNQSDESWSGIDVQLKRRYDLIPNLVESVKGYAKHETSTFEKVIHARNIAIQSQGPAEKSKAENEISTCLKTIFALSESYPDLKANQNFTELQKVLAEIEDQIQNARRYYNAVTRDFNTKCETFPSVLIANGFGFKKRIFFEANASEKENVKVSF